MSKPKVLLCTGFHRSASSVTANYISNAGLNIGAKFIGATIANRGGHFEDARIVDVHNTWLKQNSTNWQFYDEVELGSLDTLLGGLNKYIKLRDSINKNWGVKDPRICLALPEWSRILGERGHYLFVLRHWSSCIESLLHRHSREVAFAQAAIDPLHFSFWQSPTLAARMWLSYCRRMLAFSEEYPARTLVVTQRALFDGQPVLKRLNQKFSFDLDESAKTPFRKEWLRDQANSRIMDMLPDTLVAELDNVWHGLLDCANLQHLDEEPVWVSDMDIPISTIDAWIAKYQSTLKQGNNKGMVARKIQAYGKDLIAELEAQVNEKAVAELFKQVFMQKTIDLAAFPMVCEWCETRYSTSIKVNEALARWLQRHQQWTLAKKVWHACISLNVVRSCVYFQLAQCYQKTGNSSLAFDYIMHAIEKDARNPNFWVLKAELFREKANFVDARVCFERATKLSSESPSVILPYCDFLEQEKDIEKARELIKGLLKVCPEKHVVQKMAVRLALPSDDGKAVYAEYQFKMLSRLTREQRCLALFPYLVKSGGKVAEQDLLSRVLMHWELVGLDF